MRGSLVQVRSYPPSFFSPGRRAREIGAALLIVAASAGCGDHAEHPPAAVSRPDPAGRPNVLIVSFDTTRADALSCYGGRPDVTPNLAHLASEGVVFETAFSPVPLTLPAHATLLTGLDPCRHSARDNGAYALPRSATTLAETLRDAGWSTFAVVASIVLLPRFGLDQGFDRYDADGLVVTAGNDHERTADQVVTAARADWPLQEPFFGFVHFYDAHRPYRAPADLEAKFGDPYLAELRVADHALGELLHDLRSDGRLDRTIVVVVADHGESRGEHGESTHGTLLHDATQRIPLIVRAPGIKPNRVTGVVATLADVMPTVLELLKLAPPANLDGRSLVAALRPEPGFEMDSGDAYLETLYPRRAFDFAPLFGIRTDEWKLVLGARPHLWHVADDPKELHDVAADHAEIIALLTRRLLHRRDERGAPLTASSAPLTGDELKVLGGLGYVSSNGTGGGSGRGTGIDDDDAERPDPYDDAALIEEIAQATLLIEEGKGDAALARFEQLATKLPRCAHVHQSLGALLGQRGDHVRAYGELTAAALLRPGSADLWVEVALAAYLAQKPAEAEAALTKALALPGCPPRASFMLAELTAGRGDKAAARRTLDALLARRDLSEQDRGTAQAQLRELDR